MKFATELAGVSWSNLSFEAVDGVITIPPESVGPFQSLIDAGQLVAIAEPDPAPTARSAKKK